MNVVATLLVGLQCGQALPHSVPFEVSNVTAIPFTSFGMSQAYRAMTSAPFHKFAIADEGGSTFFWDGGGLNCYTLGGTFSHSEAIEMRRNDWSSVVPFETFDYFSGRKSFPDVDAAGPTLITLPIYAGPFGGLFIYKSNELFWNEKVLQESGIAPVETNWRLRERPIGALFKVTYPEVVLSAAVDRAAPTSIAATVAQHSAHNSGGKQRWDAPAKIYVIPYHPAQPIADAPKLVAEIPVSYPEGPLLYDSSRSAILTLSPNESLIKTNTIIGNSKPIPLTAAGSDKGFKLWNLTWHPDGRVFVSMVINPGYRAKCRLWMLDLSSERWKYIGPYCVLGASRNGVFQLLTTPDDKNNAWLVKVAK